jgi:putative membrane protein
MIRPTKEADLTTMETRSAQELAEDRTSMAATRTLLAADRTLMAWVRTALSMNSFGFTIYKVLEALQQAGREFPRDQTPRNVGLFLSALGTAAIVMGTLEYLGTVRTLRRFQAMRLGRPSLVMALLMSIGGAFLFFSIITGLF